jgi:acyl-CoA thioesterase I
LSFDAVILTFGDSLTYGVGARRHESYPTVLQQLTGRTVVNSGVPGELSGEGLARLPGVVAREQPDLVVLCHGGNDLLRRRDRAETEQNLRAMVTHLQEREIAVVLIGVPEVGVFLRTAELYRSVATDLAVPLQDDIIPSLLGDTALKADQIHPNAAGYALLAEAVDSLLRQHGAL